MNNARHTMHRFLPTLCRGLFLALLVAVSVPGPGTTKAAADTSQTYVMLVGGLNGDPEQLRDKAQSITRLHRYFSETAGVPAANLTVWTAPESLAHHLGATSTRDALRAHVEALSKRIGPGDDLVFYYVGQANIVKEQLRLNLPGPDLTHEEVAEALAPMQAARMLIVLDCPGAGLATKALRGPNRIFIAGARSDQPHSTRFSQFFSVALGDAGSDLDSDGKVSLLEAFQIAAQNIDAIYRDQRLMKNETPLLEDDNDAEPSQAPWRFASTGKDGRHAATYFPGGTLTPDRQEEAPAEDRINNGGEPHENSP